MIKLNYLFFFLLLLNLNLKAENFVEAITFGHVTLGDERIKIDESNFLIESSLPKESKAKINLKPNTFEWVRTDDVLLSPRARLEIQLKIDPENSHINYRGHSVSFQMAKKNYSRTEIFVSLFDDDPIEIINNNKVIGKINLKAKRLKKKNDGLLIDYSCSRNNINVEGLEGEYFILGCRIHRVGEFGKEKQMLELLWQSPHLKMDQRNKPPYMIIYFDSTPVTVSTIDKNGKSKKLKITAKLPQRMNRLKTAYGFGPYAFDSGIKNKRDIEPISTSLMFYFNFNLNKTNSIRGFEALVFNDAIFNNAGIYFANDIASVWDNKIIITTLIGFQALYFKYNNDSKAHNDIIFPQGLEILWKHAFGIENYIVSYGMFLDPSESYDYQNLWIRWGKNYFWEINFIGWEQEDSFAKMWGLSLGIPFKGFF